MLFSLFFSYGNENTKKEALTVELPLEPWPIWLLQNIFLLCYSLKIPLLYSLLNYGTNIMLKNGTPSPSRNTIFKISQ
jgi:hypothetical protein